MVAQSDLTKISFLHSEYKKNVHAIDILAKTKNPHILGMRVTGYTENGQPTGPSWDIDTSYMPVPENMIEQIRILLRRRQGEIRDELHGMGVTLDDEPEEGDDSK